MTIWKRYEGNASFSDDLIYRYHLDRNWHKSLDKDKGKVVFIMLNPSTADETKTDPTVARCINYAREWGYDSVDILNLFALRSTDPKKLLRVEDPIGPENDKWMTAAIHDAAMVIAAWGTIADKTRFKLRSKNVIAMVHAAKKDLYCLKITKDGDPAHPLYLPGDLQPIMYRQYLGEEPQNAT